MGEPHFSHKDSESYNDPHNGVNGEEDPEMRELHQHDIDANAEL